MREIKFRVFDIHSKTYTHDAHYYHEFIRWMSNERYICEQFTGLKDKQGKSIYEGDILGGGHLGFTCAVTFDNGCFQLKTNEQQGISPLTKERAERLTVLGNINQPEQVQQ
jgi:hypothetical protein